jgi:hypothetical protein
MFVTSVKIQIALVYAKGCSMAKNLAGKPENPAASMPMRFPGNVDFSPERYILVKKTASLNRLTDDD